LINDFVLIVKIDLYFSVSPGYGEHSRMLYQRYAMVKLEKLLFSI